jgi:hypothetical protein
MSDRRRHRTETPGVDRPRRIEVESAGDTAHVSDLPGADSGERG